MPECLLNLLLVRKAEKGSIAERHGMFGPGKYGWTPAPSFPDVSKCPAVKNFLRTPRRGFCVGNAVAAAWIRLGWHGHVHIPAPL